GSTSTSLISSVNPSVSGQAISLTATITAVAPAAGTPTATVTFFDGATNLGSAALDASGQATLNIASFVVGSHSLTASYNGDGSFNASTSAALTQSVGKGSSSISLVSSLNPSFFGQNVTFTATVTPSTATGTATFFDGVTSIGSAALSSGQAIFTTSSLAAGSHAITAQYGGDTDNLGSTSPALTQDVNPI